VAKGGNKGSKDRVPAEPENSGVLPSGCDDRVRHLTPRNRLRAEQPRALETRNRIISAAVLEFAKFGYEGASVHAIAKNADAKQTLITYHFDGKEGLWKAALTSINNELRSIFQSRMDGLRGVDDATKLRLLLADFIRFSAQHPEFHAIMSHVASRNDDRLQWLMEEYVKPFFEIMESLIVSAQESSRFIKGNPRHLLYLFIGAAVRIFMVSAEAEQILGRPIFDDAMIEDHTAAVLGLFFRAP
jgi:TetR/AcrR family transcriptional regulator